MARHPLALIAVATALLAGCERTPPRTGSWQGYCEGEFVQVASPLAGRVEQLAVRKGERVAAGAPLFTLERTAELAAEREADARLRQARARLEDAGKGLRPSEIAALEARLGQARAIAGLSGRDLERIERLHASGALAEGDLDRARFGHEANRRQVAELEAQLATARLGGRADVVAAAEAEVATAQAALDKAHWSVAQKTQAAPADALVYDRLYREGEFVPAGLPVVSLLPPGNLKVRFFVPEAEFAPLKAGDPVQVLISGLPAPLAARISFLSPRPEYTPPVLYNRENRAKLVFLVEAVPADPAAARDLHPGQPVDVRR